MIYDPAHVTIVGAVRVPRSPKLKEAIAAQASMPRAQAPMPRARGRGVSRGCQWFLRERQRAMPPPPSGWRSAATSSYAKDGVFKTK